jgi:dTDP-6-deoxy-L-talose 4-dehydrogenase (NAD+)
MRVAVTGASGFVGRHVVRALHLRGATVTAISRHPDAPLTDAVAPLAMDIGKSRGPTFDRIGRPDVLVHLAWSGLPNYQSAQHLERELPIQSAFLESCVRSGLARLVVTGTCLEYGMRSGELFESASTAPATAYAEAKHTLHQHLSALRERHSFDFAWLRLFYLYGPGQAPTSLYTQLRAAVASGSGGFDMSAGDQIRDFLAIETAAAYIADLALNHANAGIVNVCSGQPTSVIDIVSRWLQEWDVEIVLNRGVYPYPDYEPFAYWGSARRLHFLLGKL